METSASLHEVYLRVSPWVTPSLWHLPGLGVFPASRSFRTLADV